ncbi:MAG: right-handed parallel beta-helix repeat-containing protein, partial [Sandaracinobacteroides sp.]
MTTSASSRPIAATGTGPSGNFIAAVPFRASAVVSPSASAGGFSLSAYIDSLLRAYQASQRPAAVPTVALVPSVQPLLPAAPAPTVAISPVVQPAAQAPTMTERVVETAAAVVGAVVDAVAGVAGSTMDAATSAARAVTETTRQTIAVIASPPASSSGVFATAVPTATAAPAPAPIAPAPVAPSTTPTTSQPVSTEQSAALAAGTTVTSPTLAAKVFEVRTAAELATALKAALDTGSAEIRVFPGNYGNLVWRSKSHSLGRVYVVPATTTMPVFSFVDLSYSSNLSFHGMKVSGASQPLVALNAARDMTWTGGLITSASPDKSPWDSESTGIQVRFSTNVTIQDVRFEDIRKAVWAQRSSKVNLRYNSVSYMREGFNIVAISQINLVGNHFSHFYPKYQNSEHPDAIQFWTNGETVGSSNVSIRENVIVMGAKRSIQGVFVGCETEGVRYKNWEVTRNVYYGSSVHGLSFGCTDGLKVWNNVVVASPHADVNNSVRAADGTTSGGYLPRIRAKNSTGMQVWNNVSMTGLDYGSQGIAYDNFDLVDAMGWGGLAWTDVLGARPTSEAPVLAEFVNRNPSLIRTRGGGINATFLHGVRPVTQAATI